jgi:hypothetical protein
MQDQVICEICKRRPCLDPWTVCPECYKSRLDCIRGESKQARQMRIDNEKLIGSTTPGMKKFAYSVRERLGRKVIRHFRQEVFLEDEQDDESERDS